MANALLIAVLLAAALVAAADSANSVDALGAKVGTAAPRRVVDGVLSMLGVTLPEASQEDADDDQDTPDDGSGGAAKKAGDRGIHKKKHWYHHHLWHAYYYWAWAFAVVAIKFKVALLVIWGHLTYFVIALIRMLLREVPQWLQLKRDPGPTYGPQYGPQYGQYGYSAPNSYAPYKRRAGSSGAAPGAAEAASGVGGGSGADLAYGAYATTSRRR